MDWLAIVISLFALGISGLTYRYNRRKTMIIRAIDLSKEYAKLINDISDIINIAKHHANIFALIKKNDLSLQSDFTRDELRNVYNPVELNELENFFSFKSADYELLLQIYMISQFEAIRVVSQGEKRELQVSPTLLRYHFRNKVNSLLNALEYFAMSFTSRIADSHLVYQSLHQSFCELIKTLYYPIAQLNDTNSEKLFTNIIKLYHEWTEITETQAEKFYNTEVKSKRKRQRVYDRLKKALH